MEKKALSTTFQCKLCEFTTHYSYFGRKLPFCKEIILLEDAYVMKDPFVREKGFLVLGGCCSVCRIDVCCNQKCSVFYSKRFCIPCCMKHLEEFPPAIKQELIKNSKST